MTRVLAQGNYNRIWLMEGGVVLRVPVLATDEGRLLAERQCETVSSLRTDGAAFLPDRRILIGAAVPGLPDSHAETLDRSPWAVAEQHVGCSNLSDWLRTGKEMSLRRRVAVRLCRAVAALHRAGVTHGDLSAANVRLGADPCPEVWLVDLDTLAWPGCPPRPSHLEAGSTGYTGSTRSAVDADRLALAVLVWETLLSERLRPPPFSGSAGDRGARRMAAELTLVNQSLGELFLRAARGLPPTADTWCQELHDCLGAS